MTKQSPPDCPATTQHQARAEARHAIVREIVEDWNPLARAPGHVPRPGEYDGLIASIVGAVEHESSTVRVASVIHETAGMMGVALGNHESRSIAQQVFSRLQKNRLR